MIAGDDDHKLENNPGRGKALEASMAVNGMVVFPNFTVEQREEATIMGQVFGVILILGVVMGFVFRAQAQDGNNLLVLDVYSVKLHSDAAHEKAFALWAKSLRASDGGSYEHSPVIHEIYR